MIFNEPEPWLKARICPAALAQSVPRGGPIVIAQYGLERLKLGAELRMAQIDALPPEWRAYVHEHGWSHAKRAMREFGKRGVKRASILADIKLEALDL